MGTGKCIFFALVAAFVAAPLFATSASDSSTASVITRWAKIEKISVTVPTTQILAHKFTLRNNSLHDPLFKALRNLYTNDTRLQFWYSVINSAVPELKEPTATETFWDFRYMDALMADYYANTSGRHHINIGTISHWMFKVPPLELPSDPGVSFYPYTGGTRGDLLKDLTGQQFAEYQVRLYEWYAKGGFTDELGKFHKSGYHYKIDYWGVLNEPDFENGITVEQYTKIYDAVTTAIHKIDSQVKFFGPEISGAEVAWAKYFLNPINHTPRALPVEWFSFHNYVTASNDSSAWHAKYFTNLESGQGNTTSASAFVDKIKQVMKIRDELSPHTKLIIDELGTFNIVKPGEEVYCADEPYKAFNSLYWNANGANWAVNFITAEKLGVPLISASQMVGYPTQCPSIAMFDPDTARPNAHYWALNLVNSNFGPGDKLVNTASSSEGIVAQAAITSSGRKVLLVNTTDQQIAVDLSNSLEMSYLTAKVVDQASVENKPRQECVKNSVLMLAPFAVAVVFE